MSESNSQSKSLFGRVFGFIWTVAVSIYRLTVIVGLVIFAGLLWVAFQGGKPVKVENNIALVVAPTGFLVEQRDREPGQQFLEDLSGEPPSQSVLRDVVTALEEGAKDPRIAFAVIKLDGMVAAGLPQLQEVAEAEKVFQAAGKKVIAYGPWYDQDQYYAAAQANEVVMDPMGMVALEGYSVYSNYFKEGLDKLGVAVNVFRVGEYKSAVEPFLRNDMSAEAKAANLEWLGDLWRDYGKGVATARKLPEGAATDYVDKLRASLEQSKGDAAQYAKTAGLITHIETLQQFRARMGEKVGIDHDHGSFRQINYHDYLRAREQEQKKLGAAANNKIALVVVQGDIVDGPGEQGVAGGDTISDLLDEVRRDSDVAAVVLRVNSPGGSVWGAEQIRRQVQHLRQDGKPVVASMSSVAASGGYWVSMDADEIWAHDTTITGSIGIFGLLPTIDKPLQKLGIHTDGVGTTRLAGALRLDRPISAEWSAIIQSQIDRGYQDFIGGVAKARKLPLEKVDEMARGRVWSGEDAKALGLVDQIGGLGGAVSAAARLAKLAPGSYKLEEFAPELSWASKFISRFTGSIKLAAGLAAVPGVPGWAGQLLEHNQVTGLLRWLNDPRGMYAHCLCTPSSGRIH